MYFSEARIFKPQKFIFKLKKSWQLTRQQKFNNLSLLDIYIVTLNCEDTISRRKYKVMDSGIYQKSNLKNIILFTLFSDIYLP